MDEAGASLNSSRASAF